MSKRTLPGRVKRKVSKDGRFGAKTRRPTGTVIRPLYAYITPKAEAHAKKRGAEVGSISAYIDALILKDKARLIKKTAAKTL